MALPKDFACVKNREPAPVAALTFGTSYDLPSHYMGHDVLVDPTLLDDSKKSGQLFGYDHHHGYSPALSIDECLLFRCKSNFALGMNYGDSQDLSFHIKTADLAARRFDKVEPWIQAG